MNAALAARLAVGLLVVVLAAPCLARAATQKLTLAVARGTVSLLVYVADSQAYFQNEGLDVRLLECSSGRNCVQELLNGNADVATAAELPVSLANSRGENLAIVASIASTSHQIKLVARASAGIAGPADLRGKRIATVVGSSAQFFLSRWLLFHDNDPALVKMIDMEPATMPAALARREVDAIVIWQPHAAAATAMLGEDIVALPAPRLYSQHFVLVMQRRSEQRLGVAHAAMLRALLQAQGFVTRHPRQAERLLGERLGLSMAQAAAHLHEHDFRVRLDQLLLSTMSQQLRWIGLSGQHNPMNWVDAAPLRALAPHAVTVPSTEAAAPR